MATGTFDESCHIHESANKGTVALCYKIGTAPSQRNTESPMTTPVAEAPPYFARYIDLVTTGDVRQAIREQLQEFDALLAPIDDQRSLYRYAEGKWSIREVLAHIIDAERLFVFRAMWFARGLEGALPSFDENVAMNGLSADERSWASLRDEFRLLRQATVLFFDNLPDEAWDRRGIASGGSFSVRALAFVTAGHVAHHMRILRERYLN
jgi:uncharacterized damage-inducible protein DinB